MLDALIAGAGPAGATTALLIARAGKAARIYERREFPRTKACGEYLSAGTVRALYRLGVAEELEIQARTIRGVRLHGHGVSACIDFPQPGWSLPRRVLDQVLLNAAMRAGAAVVRAHVEDARDGAEFGTIGIRLPGGGTAQAQGAAVVGADGMHSIVARKCSFASEVSNGSRFALGGHYTGFTRLDGYIDMFVHRSGYVAVNPLSDHVANVMIIVDEAELQAHREDVEAFAQARARGLAGELFENAQLEGKRIAIGPLSYRAKQFSGQHVLLAGDAAAFLDPFTGQGVYLALRCAEIAAECILSGDLRAYGQRVRREIAERDRAARRVARIIASPTIARAAAWFMGRSSWLFSPLVSRVTGGA
ncbi:MAG TPA: NAD(P)/FAD-dependent oxidoreductase [Candidatus Baltobacteraceae bacterium]